jgi:hypothetical protein
MVKGRLTVPVVRKWEHPWLQISKEEAIATYLTEPELHRLHRRFGHPSVARLYKILRTVGHDVKSKALQALTNVCHQCQMNGARPTRFKFTLHEDTIFNYEVILDIFYLESKPVLHVVDATTTFTAARFL